MADPTYPLETYSLASFCAVCRDLFDEEDTLSFVEFNLTGVLHGYQASVDLLKNRISSREELDLTTSRDIDSFIAIDEDLLIHSTPATIWPISKYEDTLTTTLRVKYAFENDRGPQLEHVHLIPNLGIIKWGVHNLIRVLFPNLHGINHTVAPELQAEFYELGMRPTLVQLLEDRAADLPPTVEAELIRARSWSGRLSLSSRTLPDYALDQFGDLLRQNLEENNVKWAKGLVFLHQIRGVKNSSFHPPDSQITALTALQRFLAQNNMEYNTLVGKWCYADIGLEIASTDQRCLSWRTDGHSLLVQHFLQISPAHARRITTLGSSKYNPDPLSHKMDSAGFRITPGARAEGPFKVAYVQAYTTDKALTYARDGHHVAKHITALQILQGHGERFVDNMYTIYRSAANVNYSVARFEARVHLDFADEVLLNPDPEVLRRSLFRFTREEFWGFKTWRALALKYIVEWQAKGIPDLRLKESALLLTAACAWMLNSLHATPDVHSASRELIEAIFPRIRRDEAELRYLPYPMRISVREEEEESDEDEVMDVEEREDRRRVVRRQPADDEYDDEDDDEAVTSRRSVAMHPNRSLAALDDGEEEELATLVRGEDLVPHAPFGVFFLRELRSNGPPVPRLLTKHIYLSDRAFQVIFGKGRHDINALIHQSSTILPAHPGRLHNKTRQVLLPLPSHNALPLNFALEEEGHALEPMARDDGSDNDSDIEEVQPDPLAGGLNAELDRVASQFFRDLLSLSPNRNGVRDAPYITIPADEIEKVTLETFQIANLSEIWVDVQLVYATEAAWTKNFDHLFPPKGVKKSGTTQTFSMAAYFRHWEQIKERLSDDSAKKARKALFKIYDRMSWAPFTYSYRIWQTRSDMKRFRKPSGLQGPAPQILFKSGLAQWEGVDVQQW
ncbi:hypothetical protein BKA70DRAFT_1453799 [Coprinopsis sp. MPI-PUGE-AT-0042]|nr:hypothetical protein BKA70DRAFT_1453788 [Coprinopsis sp. MPI-PUGE-AT-0042]KAH6866232.1 hypothetical protein BKA70DRAFT_1453799 [Coprinopsis sp. MPI-PUGE-AT-0042]